MELDRRKYQTPFQGSLTGFVEFLTGEVERWNRRNEKKQ